METTENEPTVPKTQDLESMYVHACELEIKIALLTATLEECRKTRDDLIQSVGRRVPSGETGPG